MPDLPVENAERNKEPAPPNPDTIRKDPMAEIFGPGTGTKLVGDPDDQIPETVRDFLEQYGLSKKTFTCSLFEVPEGLTVEENTSISHYRYIQGFYRSIPSLDYIAKEHGPGCYYLQFSWHSYEAVDGGTRTDPKPMRNGLSLEVSPKAIDSYKKNRFKRTLETAKEKGALARDAAVESAIESRLLDGLGGEPQNKKSAAETAKEYITSALDTVKMLGVPVGAQPPAVPAKTVEWDKVLAALGPLVLGFFQHQREVESKRQEDFNKLLMLMVTQGQNANSQLIDMFGKAQSGANAGKEYIDMIKSVVDLKEIVSPQPDTLSDKVFRIIESVAPHIMSIAATAASTQAARKSPLVGMAKTYVDNSPDFQALAKNPEEMKKTVKRMDGFFGWRQADIIMEVMGWQRPDYCPRDPNMKEPPQAEEKQEGADEGGEVAVE